MITKTQIKNASENFASRVMNPTNNATFCITIKEDKIEVFEVPEGFSGSRFKGGYIAIGRSTKNHGYADVDACVSDARSAIECMIDS